MNPADPDGDGPKKAPTPSAKDLTGLKKVSDTEFTITLTTPQSFFPTELGYTAFAPLPDSFFADNGKAFGKKPIGNGPFQVISGDGDTGLHAAEVGRLQGSRHPQGRQGPVQDLPVARGGLRRPAGRQPGLHGPGARG